VAKKDETFECPKCNGYGFILSDLEAIPCECRQHQLVAERLHQARIPPKFLNKTIDNYTGRGRIQSEVRKAARAYVSGFHLREEMKGLLIVGQIGSGKSHIAIAILKEIIKKGYRGLYYSVPELLQRIRETYSSESDEAEADVLDMISEVDLLVLDDLGGDAAPAWVRDRLYLLINRRYEENKPTIVTSRYDLEELKTQLGQRIVSRLFEMCDRLFDLPPEDYRAKFLE
jgi:DNA replication protein DnaC